MFYSIFIWFKNNIRVYFYGSLYINSLTKTSMNEKQKKKQKMMGNKLFLFYLIFRFEKNPTIIIECQSQITRIHN